MRTLDEVIDTLAFHPATPDTAPVHDSLRHAAIEFATAVWDRIPDGAEKTLAMRGIQTFLMHANCAVAMGAPADTTTGAVARVLPDLTSRSLDPAYAEDEMCTCESVVIPAGFATARQTGDNRTHQRVSEGICS